MATLEELLEKARCGELKKPRKRSLNEEHQLQCAEVRYMRGVHRDLSHVFFVSQTVRRGHQGRLHGCMKKVLSMEFRI